MRTPVIDSESFGKMYKWLKAWINDTDAIQEMERWDCLYDELPCLFKGL